MRAVPLHPASHCIVRGKDRVGAFQIPNPFHKGGTLNVIASDSSDWTECGFALPAWEHVSVSTLTRCPTWEELCYVKHLWWRDDEVVIQLHVAAKDHVNHHPNCLHLWKPIGVTLPLPPSEAVGPK